MRKKGESEQQRLKRFKCSDCDYASTSNTKLKEHSERVHLKLKPHCCNLCDFRTYSEIDLDYHILRHTGEKPFKCDQCSYTCKTKRGLKLHQGYKHSDLRPFPCKHCPFQAKKKPDLVQHEKTHFPEKFKTIQCPHCPYLCNLKSRLNSHLLVHSEERPFECPLCPYKAKTKAKLNRHTNTHWGIKPYQCQQCDRSFGARENLKRHNSQRHSELRPFACPFTGCDSKFKDKTCLLNHNRSVHNKEKSHCCSICPKTFSRKGNLDAHIRAHLREKIFKCKNCDYSTWDKNCLCSHYLHTHSGIRSLSCRVCGDSFKTKSDLNRHQRVHDMAREFPCEQCNYRGASETALVGHVSRAHSVEGMVYKCKYCKREFSKRWLRYHERACKVSPSHPEPFRRADLTEADCKPCSVVVRRLKIVT